MEPHNMSSSSLSLDVWEGLGTNLPEDIHKSPVFLRSSSFPYVHRIHPKNLPKPPRSDRYLMSAIFLKSFKVISLDVF